MGNDKTVIIIPVLLFLMFSLFPAYNVSAVDWFSGITLEPYHWKADKSELYDLTTHERYFGAEYLGGIETDDNPDIKLTLRSLPPNDFSLETDRLDFIILLGGTLSISNIPANSDYHFLILPTGDFFEWLVEQESLLSEITGMTFLDSDVVENNATVNMQYNEYLNVTYEWDTRTGFLSRKEVISESGLRLLVVLGTIVQTSSEPPSETTTNPKTSLPSQTDTTSSLPGTPQPTIFPNFLEFLSFGVCFVLFGRIFLNLVQKFRKREYV